jgi:NADPH:quinone reductase-like Zn-dependent oxidoreductase
VQLARRAGARVIATAGAADLGYVRDLGADEAIDFRTARFEAALGGEVDAVIDLVGGVVQERSLAILKPGTGVLVSAVSQPDQGQADRRGVRARFMLVDVTAAALAEIGRLLDAGELRAGSVGEVLPLEEAVRAHRMLEGEPHRRGKIVLRVAGAG